VSYALEKRVSKSPEKFGRGAIEGVAAPESANNAASSGAFVPLLTLGIPSNPVVAMLFAGLLIHNITPGPLLLKKPSGYLLGGHHEYVCWKCHAFGS
jgi:putative tricarboxylic transport membrane protein